MAEEKPLPRYSDYFYELDSSTKERYLEKLGKLGHNVDDPYTFQLGTSSADMPELEYPDTY